MLSSIIKISLFRNLACVGLLTFYFVRICDQAAVKAAAARGLLIRETGRNAVYTTRASEPVDTSRSQAGFSLTEK